nr:MAG TPA: hypothetical protein [Bacteriophage sp.]
MLYTHRYLILYYSHFYWQTIPNLILCINQCVLLLQRDLVQNLKLLILEDNKIIYLHLYISNYSTIRTHLY